MEKTLRIFSIIVSSVIFLNNTVLANEVVLLERGKPAPYSGVLFPVEKANELRKMAIELDTLRAVNESYIKSIGLYQKTIQLHDEKYNLLYQQNDRLAEALVESRRSNDLQRVIWFTLGVLATGFAFYGAKKITQ
jgi:hypothetical protein